MSNLNASEPNGTHTPNGSQSEMPTAGLSSDSDYTASNPSNSVQPSSAQPTSAQPTSAPSNSAQPTSAQLNSPNPLEPPPLYFLSVNYYSAALLSDLMYSLEPNQGIVIVNNSPTDRMVHGLAGETYGGGQVTVIDAPENGGFGAGCNIGLQWIYARSPHALVWLINPDTQLLPQAVSTVRSCFRQREIAILGTPILNVAGKLWFGSGRFNRWTGAVTSHHAVKDSLARPVLVRWVSGCSMVLNLAVLGHCPQFDDVYFLYYEDCDLCERYYQQGYPIAIAPIPAVIHAVSSITGRYTRPKYIHATFSKLTFLRRHATPLALWLNLIYLFVQSLWLKLGMGKASVRENREAARGRWMGIEHFLSAPETRPPVVPSGMSDSSESYPSSTVF